MDEESASKFINALIKSVQTLCHGYVDFNNGVEIIGYINLSVDKGSSFDYVLKEKVCKNEENSTLFISNSFHAQPKPDKPVKAKNGQVETHISQRRHSVDTGESNQLSSAISSISTVLSGSHSQEKSRSIFSAKDSPASSSSSSHHIQSTAKRKGEDDVNHDHPPKAANLSHESSSQHFFHSESSPHVSATSSPVDSKPSVSDVAGNVGESSRRTSTVTSEEMQSHIAGTMLPQTATVTSDANSDLGVNLASSVLERIDDQSNSEMQEKDDSDLDLEVTFIKEEYVEGERSACEFQNSGGGQYGRGPDQRASTSSDSMADTPLYPVALHTSAAAATFAPGSHEMAAMAQHYSGIPSSSLGIGAGPSTSHQPGPSGMRDMRGRRGSHRQLAHAESTVGFRKQRSSHSPPLAHAKSPAPVSEVSVRQPALDLSIKAEKRTTPFPFLFPVSGEIQDQECFDASDDGFRTIEDARQKAKEKSKQYREKQKMHRMADATYDLIFRQRVAERKRRQRLREKMKKIKFGVL